MGVGKASLFSLSIVLLFSSALVAQEGACVSTGPKVEEAKLQVQKAYADFVVVASHADADGIENIYTKDALVIPPGMAPIVGNKNIRKFYSDSFPRGVLAGDTFTNISLTICSDSYVDVSEYSGHFRMANKDIVGFHGRNLVIWQKQPDGSLKISHDAWGDIKDAKQAAN
jgi:ketosteroid isomerase-like protein